MAIVRAGLVTKYFQALFTALIFAMSSLGHCKDLEVKDFLKTISVEERKDLEDLFYLLFKQGDFAYAFFGIKPMCRIDYTMQYVNSAPHNESFTRETYLARKGFDIWAKHQHFFPMKNTCLRLHQSDKYGGHFSFVLINPHQCLSVIKKHLTLFQKHYGQELNPEGFLELLSKGEFFQEGKADPTILGLLLGYPKKDVFAFNKRPKKKLTPCPLSLHRNPLTPIKASYFMTDRNEEELKDIKTEYALKKTDLVDFYYSPDFLEKVLERLL